MALWGYLHFIPYHCISTLSVNLVWAWQDKTATEWVLETKVWNTGIKGNEQLEMYELHS